MGAAPAATACAGHLQGCAGPPIANSLLTHRGLKDSTRASRRQVRTPAPPRQRHHNSRAKHRPKGPRRAGVRTNETDCSPRRRPACRGRRARSRCNAGHHVEDGAGGRGYPTYPRRRRRCRRVPDEGTWRRRGVRGGGCPPWQALSDGRARSCRRRWPARRPARRRTAQPPPARPPQRAVEHFARARPGGPERTAGPRLWPWPSSRPSIW